jgi:hypothetical protein
MPLDVDLSMGDVITLQAVKKLCSAICQYSAD